MPKVTVQPGECLSTIARRAGFTDAKKIWDLPQNSELRGKRKSLDVLHPGDVVFIPDKAEATFSISTGKQHVFQVKPTKKKLHVIVRDGANRPKANAKYELRIGGVSINGTTDHDGAVLQPIPLQAKSAELEFDDQLWNLDIGALNPTRNTPDDGTSGIQARLKNLGLLVNEEAGQLCDRTKKAIIDFKVWAGDELKDVNDAIDDVFIDKLEKAHRGELKPQPTRSASSNASSNWTPINWEHPDDPHAVSHPPEFPPAKQEQESAVQPQPSTSESTASAASSAPPPQLGAIKVEERDEIPETPRLCTANKSYQGKVIETAKKNAEEQKKSAKKNKKQSIPASSAIAPNQPNTLKPTRAGLCSHCSTHSDCLDNDYNFLLSVARLAAELEAKPEYLLAIMHWESGHLFSPEIQSTSSDTKATGLIQITISTAKDLKVKLKDLRQMCRIEQLDWVKAYLEGKKSLKPHPDFTRLIDVVLAIFEPIGLNPKHEILGVSKSKCTRGPLVYNGSGEIEVPDTNDVYEYYKKNGHPSKDGGIIYDSDKTIIGVRRSSVYYYYKYTGKTMIATAHQIDVFKNNPKLGHDGVILRTDYPSLLENNVLTKCGKESCAKIAELYDNLSSNPPLVIKKLGEGV